MQHSSSTPPVADLPALDLPLLRARVTLRLLEDAQLPEYLGPLLRGGFGYAFQRASCPQTCWQRSETCPLASLCPYRWVFETPHPPEVRHLHDLRDVPRPFVIEPPDDRRTRYSAGSALEFGLVLIGRGIDHLPFFLFGFEQLGRMGLGRQQTAARLERVEALRAWAPTGPVIYQDGRVSADAQDLPLITPAEIWARAATLSPDLVLRLRSPLRLRVRGDFLRTVEPAALIQALCWRLNALAIFHGPGPWPLDHRALVARAREVVVERAELRWVELLRTSTRGPQPQTMPMGGLLGSCLLRGVPPELRALLLAGSLVHVGKACVFGHGKYDLDAA